MLISVRFSEALSGGQSIRGVSCEKPACLGDSDPQCCYLSHAGAGVYDADTSRCGVSDLQCLAPCERTPVSDHANCDWGYRNRR